MFNKLILASCLASCLATASFLSGAEPDPVEWKKHWNPTLATWRENSINLLKKNKANVDVIVVLEATAGGRTNRMTEEEWSCHHKLLLNHLEQNKKAGLVQRINPVSIAYVIGLKAHPTVVIQIIDKHKYFKVAGIVNNAPIWQLTPQ